MHLRNGRFKRKCIAHGHNANRNADRRPHEERTLTKVAQLAADRRTDRYSDWI